MFPTEFTIHVKPDFTALVPAVMHIIDLLEKRAADRLEAQKRSSGGPAEPAPATAAVSTEAAPSAPETPESTPAPPADIVRKSPGRPRKPRIDPVQPIEAKHEQVEATAVNTEAVNDTPAAPPISVPGFDDPAPAPQSAPALDNTPATEEEVRALKSEVLKLMPLIGDEKYSKLRVELATTLKAKGYAPELDGHGRVTFKTLTRGMVAIVSKRFAEEMRSA